MAYDNFENYYIKIDELAIILAGKDLKNWYGFLSENLSGNYDQFTKSYIYEQLARLYQKGYVDWDDGMVKTNSPITELVDIAKQAEYCIEITNAKEETYRQIAYFTSNQCMIMENSPSGKETIKFSFWEGEAFINEIMNLPIFPEKDSVSLLKEEKMPAGIKVEERGCLELKKIKTGTNQAVLRIVEEGAYSHIHLQETFSEHSMPYRREIVREILKKWMERKDEIL